MAKKKNTAADITYDYLVAHKGQIFKYIAAAAATWLLQFFFKRFLGAPDMLLFFLRMILLFILLKIWAYPQSGKEGFTIARQGMIAFMLLLISTTAINYFVLLFAALTQKPLIIAYLGAGILELLYFIFYQFLIFREKN